MSARHGSRIAIFVRVDDGGLVNIKEGKSVTMSTLGRQLALFFVLNNVEARKPTLHSLEGLTELQLECEH